MGGISRRDSAALLETAFDAGIRHFDTAPSYGYGQAEALLGETFRGRRDRIAIATKFGIRPPRNRRLLAVARSVLVPLVARLPQVKSRLARAAGALKERARFSPGELRQSIEGSLAALRTDYIDLFLLHEATAADLNDELLAELERSITAGKIRGFGIGSERTAAAEIYRRDRRFCGIMQFEWSVLSSDSPTYAGSFVITHRSLSQNFPRLFAWLRAHPQEAESWSRELNIDLASPADLSRLMLAAARHVNPDGLTLFSSRRAQNIRENAALMRDSAAVAAGGAFAALVARERAVLGERASGELELSPVIAR